MRRTRLPDWTDRLMHTVAAHQAHAFAWGSFDCATLFGDCVLAITGEDPLARFKPWRSSTAAARALFQSGSPDVAAFVATILPGIAPASAKRGDFGYAAGPRDRLQFPAVIVGAEALSRNETGFVVIPRGLIVDAFTVG